ncbi:MAG TPA: rhomboid family intramembrane serine protease [Aquihabitans sp.]|nr:rhomboid family intramembrane serine protease [Aquihabitans sp.]
MAIPIRDDRSRAVVPWVTLALVVANVVIFLFVQPSGFQFGASEDAVDQQQTWQLRDRDEFLYRYGTVPCEVVARQALADDPADCVGPRSDFLPDDKAILLSLLTAIFLHASIDHLAGNLLFLWVFGAHVEQRLGRANFLGLYVGGGVLASLAFVALHQRSAEPLIGASGAIAVAMGAYLVLVPRGRVLTVIVSAALQVVYVPAAVVLALFFVTQFFIDDEGVAWEAHAAGMLIGIAGALVLSRIPAVRERGRQQELDADLRVGREF